ncbi:MAG: nitroreductase family protein [Rikenellaceae bacterium]|nr:nitroreductase family protein [Rikenellaceae bacterium]
MMEVIDQHRSIRKYKDDPVPQEILDKILNAAIRASNTGNMQMYSIIVTTDKDIKKELSPCHFNQPMVNQAPVILTFCADINRFSKWCELRGAKPEYDNFLWFLNGMTDAILASGNAALEAETHGLGICYLGTTLYTAEKICDILELPQGVVPVTTLVVGYPDGTPELTDRLPLEGVIHKNKYREYTDQNIEDIWKEKENSEETGKLIEINGLPNLARVFTDKRYTGKDNQAFSDSYMAVLKKQGFLK